MRVDNYTIFGKNINVGDGNQWREIIFALGQPILDKGAQLR